MRATADPQHISDLINYWGRYYNLDPRLARAVFTQESNLNPNIADSSAGAQGIAQIMPETQKALGVTDPYDVNQAIRGGVQYLRQGYDAALANNHPNPAAAAVQYYNPGAGADYVKAVAGRYAVLPPDQAPAGAAAQQPPPGPVPRWSISEQAAGGLNHVDPRLLDVAARASGYLPAGWRAELQSGYREVTPQNPESYHRLGQAIDVQLYDEDGNKIPNDQDSRTFRIYEEYAQNSRKLQSMLYPELNDQFRWGGYFWNGGKPNYGSSDQMHFDISGQPTGAGDWEHGLNDRARHAGWDWGGGASEGMGDVAQYQLPQSQGNVAVAVHPSGNAAVARSLPDQPPMANAPAAATAAAGAPAEVVSSPTQPVFDPVSLKFRQVPRPPAPEAAAPQVAAAPAPAAPARVLSDEAIGKMGPAEAAMAGTNEQLTDADRQALIARLTQFQQPQTPPAPGT